MLDLCICSGPETWVSKMLGKIVWFPLKKKIMKLPKWNSDLWNNLNEAEESSRIACRISIAHTILFH